MVLLGRKIENVDNLSNHNEVHSYIDIPVIAVCSCLRFLFPLNFTGKRGLPKANRPYTRQLHCTSADFMADCTV